MEKSKDAKLFGETEKLRGAEVSGNSLNSIQYPSAYPLVRPAPLHGIYCYYYYSYFEYGGNCFLMSDLIVKRKLGA